MFYLKDVSWERIHLNLWLEPDETSVGLASLRFYLVSLSGKTEAEFSLAEADGQSFRLSLNVTNNGLNRCVTSGTYRVLAADDTGKVIPVLYEGLFETLTGFGRGFVYDSGKGVYSVSFMIDEFTDLPELRLVFLDAGLTPSDKGNPYGKKRLSDRLKSGLKKTAGAANVLSQRLIYAVVRAFRFLRKPHILFLCEKRDVLAPNMLAVYQRMHQRGMTKTYVIDSSTRNTESRHFSKLSTAGVIVKIAKAETIIVDDYVPAFNSLALADSVRVIQLWHAGAGFKGVGYSRWGHFGCPPPFSAHRRNDFAIADSMAIRHFFSEPFGILEEQVIPTGMPRMDAYLSEEHRRTAVEKLYASYPALKGKQIILFAPTYRGRNRKTAYYPYELIDFDGLYRYCEDNDAAVLFKMHPWVPGEVALDARYRDRFFSMNAYPDINELFYITDLLITDYSSCIYEFMLMKKPMLFFAFDKDRYSVSRGFHRDYASNVPGKICMTFDEVLRAMRARDFEFEKVERMLPEYFDHADTDSSDRVIDWLVLDRLPDAYASALKERRDAIKRARARSFPPVDSV
ncbi:CDP-glycerol glycerophosphotransferase family protein [Ruminococcus sp.]|uniref:CDP-glycerol glycerophosphotransferase family protein n=1 Tax=Ruminococcus sp. TaxID=41978 RepID=UPI00388E72F7